MIRTLTLASALALTCTLTAQNWTVGVPVDVQISTVTVYGGGCAPDPQATLFIPLLPVTGVTYYYRVVNTNGGTYTMVPGPANVLAAGDTVHVPTTQITEVYNQAGAGGLELEVRAEGTPTVAGETHPCAPNNLWMSNLLLCNEGLNCLIQLSCQTVAGSTGVEENTADQVWYSAAMGQVRILDAGIRTAQVLDAQGRVVAATNVSGGTMDLGARPAGLYTVRAQRADGALVVARFVLAR